MEEAKEEKPEEKQKYIYKHYMDILGDKNRRIQDLENKYFGLLKQVSNLISQKKFLEISRSIEKDRADTSYRGMLDSLDTLVEQNKQLIPLVARVQEAEMKQAIQESTIGPMYSAMTELRDKVSKLQPKDEIFIAVEQLNRLMEGFKRLTVESEKQPQTIVVQSQPIPSPLPVIPVLPEEAKKVKK